MGYKVVYFAEKSIEAWEEHVPSILRVEALIPICFILIFWVAYSMTLKMEAICCSVKSIDFQKTTRRYILEEAAP
jgi:hypothetical protein